MREIYNNEVINKMNELSKEFHKKHIYLEIKDSTIHLLNMKTGRSKDVKVDWRKPKNNILIDVILALL